MNSIIRDTLTKIFDQLGYQIIPNWRMSERALAQHLAKLFEAQNINCVIDVGGNKGQYRDFLRSQVGFKGFIETFEPIRSNIDILRERSKDDQKWSIYDYALGSVSETKVLNVMNIDQFSSFLPPAETEFSRKNSIASREEVEVRTLDQIWDGLVRNINDGNFYLKLDTQGFDLEVAKGGRKSLSKISALQTEVSVQALYEGMPNFITSINEFGNYGFDLSGLFPVVHDSNMRVVEFDCIMINRKFLK